MQKSYDYDAIVIGSGPGGEGAAMGLVKQGAHVAVIERYHNIGGGCTHWGTIPSKALRHAVSRIIEFNQNPLYSDHSRLLRSSFSDILKHTENVIQQQTTMRQGFYERNHCEIFQGDANFVDAHTIEVVLPDGTRERLTAGKFVIACGSRPYHPDNVDFSHPRIYDSDSILDLRHEPSHVIIYGAGVIGCEYASVFRGLGVKVDLINTRDRLLAFLDQEMSDSLSYHFWNSGVVIRHNEEFEEVEGNDDGVIVHLKSGKKVKADCLLYANGRTGNTDSLSLENAGLEADSRGLLKVNNMYQTAQPHIFAVGDVIGYPSLASAAYDQGRIAALAMIKGEATAHLVEDIPTGIYTIPEISSVGKTEQQLTAMKVPYEVGRAQFKHLARAQIVGMNIGSLKILFHRDTKEILGIHCFGERAAEIIHIGQAIMEQKNGGNTIEYFVNTTFNYPTMAEAYRVAALNGLNRLF
ncbi:MULTISPECIES: Si-specific NAD(P)(+) transhydrogenase [Tatumella]|uniref:Soluble pyridine nucleotide transhydrogenase n=1 Tax=Tatumella punctata TaxID=399969 RepID=A0ABW1VNN5_9GAMM|nr:MULTISPECIES: Si-specific NAD(P)(+) transhydrogenase [unclassified Tatumella]MBS0856558.1 Si-specific NAD(P)(+) transhydrogenase [Tatumella sp. JGM16]MBS0877957.1 Si-specific NAD(P)(+) transhydrogenase [Tatumella sp. JGM82]MBS0891663.1 Si-specific NAD(P)(+) transhydrogenase [Tatumella sp. JGM94]MBS0893792.1 Si-specific NAD(P)(+) transhydrogenase [Tatumella sp. JGM130]MBS0902513.1 Si-specific NAD(P)(+) transhydrogenase [Tatumella sp. JGM100]